MDKLFRLVGLDPDCRSRVPREFSDRLFYGTGTINKQQTFYNYYFQQEKAKTIIDEACKLY